MEIEVTKGVGPHFRGELEAAGLAHLYLGAAHRRKANRIPDADWLPGSGEAESARPEIDGPEADSWIIHLADSCAKAERGAVLAVHEAHAPEAVARIHREQAKEKLQLLLNAAKERVAGAPAGALGGKLAEYEEKAKLIDVWARDSDAGKLDKPVFALVKNRKDAYPARYATGQSVVDEWKAKRAALLGKIAALVKIYDEGVRDVQDAIATATCAALDARIAEAASSFDAAR